ncbi:unnamed protein product [Caenorhabditis angaria]|uniref:long-chain-fatty-acid--CoA ligase n=1 Tax=Caenorhabditis angaria TaxID=860376 RepID=A0A9P1IPK4_9PELO|nr:unnamed protein product [Caenorhabditis angaria]
MDMLLILSAILILIIGIIGIIANFIMIIYFAINNAHRTSFNLICISRATNNILVLSTSFLLIFFVVSILPSSPYPNWLEYFIISTGIGLYLVNEYTTVVNALNRFFAIYAPNFYSKYIGMKSTGFIISILYFYRFYAVYRDLSFYIPNGCYILYLAEYLTYYPSFNENCKNIEDLSIIIYLVIFLFSNVVILNIATFVKLATFAFNSRNMDSGSKSRLKQNATLFLQTILQDSLILVDMIFTFKLESLTKGCYAVYLIEYLTYYPSFNEGCQNIDDVSYVIYLVIFLFTIVVVTNIATFVKLAIFAFNSRSMDSSSKSRQKQNATLFLQTILQDSLILVDMIFTFKLESLSNSRYSSTFKCDLGNQSIQQSDGSRRVSFANGKSLDHFVEKHSLTVYDLHRRGLQVGGTKMMGKRVLINNELTWKWMSYEEAQIESDHLSQALRRLDLPAGEEVRIGIYSKNRTEWVLTDMAIHNFSNVTVPFYDTISNDDFLYVSNLTEVPVFFLDSADKTEKILSISEQIPTLKTIVQYDSLTPELKNLAKKKQIKIFDYQEFLEFGKSYQNRTPHIPPKPEHLATISFTSGTTGRPKGVMLTHLNLCSTLHTTRHFSFKKNEITSLSYLPLAHIYERITGYMIFYNGGKIGFFRGDPERLLDDAKSLEVDTLLTVPRVIEKVYKSIMHKLADEPLKMKLVLAAVAYKNFLYRMTNKATRETLVDKFILSKIQDLLGPNLKRVIIGAAKSDVEALSFFRGAFGVQTFEAYGQTETCGPVTFQIEGDTKIGCCGPPITCALVKLRDVPHLDYHVDKNGGEVLVKGMNVTHGYFKNEKATKEAFTEDGFMKTGDIGRWSDEGTLEIIDRVKNVFKLPQGKFVAPEKIESLFMTSKFVSQVYVHGELTKPWLVAVVVPDETQIKLFAKNELGLTNETLEELCKNRRIHEAVYKSLNKITVDHGRPRYEGIKNIYLTPEPFSPVNGLATPTLKNKRNKLEEYFRKEIDEMYEFVDEIEKMI